MGLIKKVFILAWLAYLFLEASSQQPDKLNFFHLNAEDGLSSNIVNSIAQDSIGYMWFGTRKGLSRYDGYNFKLYQNSIGDSTSITANNVTQLLVDSKGVMWVGLANYGLCRYNQQLDNFKRLYDDGTTNSLLGNSVNALGEDKYGNIWVATNEGLNKYDPSTDTFTSYPSGHLLKDAASMLGDELQITDIAYDAAANVIWIAFYNSYIGRFDVDNEICEVLAFPDKPYFSSIIFNDNKLFAGSWNLGTLIYDILTEIWEYKTFDYRGYTVKNVNADEEGNVWISTIDGIVKYRPIDGSHIWYTHIDEDFMSLSGASTMDIYFCNNDIIWVSVDFDGINYAVRNKPFDHIYVNDDFYSLSFEEVTDIEQDSLGNHYFAYFAGGIDKINVSKETRTFHKLQKVKGQSPGTVFKIFTDKSGTIWTGSWNGGLQYLDPTTNQFRSFKIKGKEPEPLNNHPDVRDIKEDSNENLWLAVHGEGVMKLNKARDAYKIYKFKDKDTIVTNNWTTAIGVQKENVWVGSVWGLTRIDSETNTTKRFYHMQHDTATISSNAINTIFVDDAQRVWIGTASGLDYYNPATESFKRFNKSNGLFHDDIKSVEKDMKGNLWVSTGLGIMKLSFGYDIYDSPILNDVKYYNRNDGLQSYEFFSNASKKDQNGVLFFGGNNGIDFFQPELISEQNQPPSVVISSVKLFNDDFIPVSGKDEGVVFSHNENMLSFEFVALSFVNAESNLYTYRLEGLEEEFSKPTTDTRVNYTHLPPGEYTFHVQGANSDGVWNQSNTSFSFSIRPPFYATTWFRLFTIVLAITIIWGIILYRTGRLRRKQLILEKTVRNRTKELRKKNLTLEEQTISLNEANVLLEERQQHIEEQSEELEAKTNHLAKTNQQLKLANSMKDKILSIIGHDLKNPFNTILGFSELLKNGYQTYDDEKRLRMLGYIHSSSKNAYSLLDNLLQWSRSQTNRLKISPNDIDIKALITDNYNLLKDSFVKKSVSFENNMQFACVAYADTNLINTVIRNLLSNAIKFSNNATTIAVNCEKAGNMVIVHVKDQGVGMEEDELSRLFDLEGSLSKSGTEGETGTGLGLLLCKEFIEKSGGKIWVNSKPDEGSIFSFSLPAGQS